MFGLNFIKADSSTYLVEFRKGQKAREGVGISFYYFGPASTLVAVPVSSKELPFIFQLQSADFQSLNVQGQLTFHISEPDRAMQMLNFTINRKGKYVSDDPQSLEDRVLRNVQVLIRDYMQQLGLRQALVSAPGLIDYLKRQLSVSEPLNKLGVNVLDVAITAVNPSPETAKALEAEVREQLLKESDDAIYIRRLSSIEQEKAVKERELATEVAIQHKQQEIEEARIEARRSIAQKQFQMDQERLQADILAEEQRGTFIQLAGDNQKAQADAAAYGIEQQLKAYQNVNPEILKALTMAKMTPEQLIAQAFDNLTQGENRIGNLNISPDLLQSLLGEK